MLPAALLALAPLALAPVSQESAQPAANWKDVPLATAPRRPLSALEREAGWQSLLNEEKLTGWTAGPSEVLRATASGTPGVGWSSTAGVLFLSSGSTAGALTSQRSFGEFELEFDWWVEPGGNSGVKVRTDPKRNGRWAYGPEYQVLCDAGHENGQQPMHEAGALYDLVAPTGKPGPLVGGTWHRGRIVAREGRLEHWIDGLRVVDTALAGPEWEAALAASKFAGDGGFAQRAGPIALQNHGFAAAFANLRIRDWDNMPGEYVDLLAGEGLAGWRALGDARYVREGDEILGEVDGGGQSFLVTEEEFGDFVFEVDVRTELPGNSGIQVRSHVREDGRLFGYQIEIDPSERAWSGGLYDEARRGWLDNLEGDDLARAAFRDGEWNRYRIECLGPWIRAWVNGVPTADHIDPLDLAGVFGLQVHSGNNTRVRWRRPRLWHFGMRAWEPISQDSYLPPRNPEGSPLWTVPTEPEWTALRVNVPPEQSLVVQSFCGEDARVESTVERAAINGELILTNIPGSGSEFVVAPEDEDGEWVSLAQFVQSNFETPVLAVAPLGTVEWLIPQAEGRGALHLTRIADRAALHVGGNLIAVQEVQAELAPAGRNVMWTGANVPKLEQLGAPRTN